MEKKTIGKFIAVLRKANGMTQKELGDKLLVSDKTVSRWECDESLPDLSLIPAIAEIFQITTDELLRGERNTSSSNVIVNDEKNKAKSEKQFKYMLSKKYLHYKSLTFISCSVLALGVIIAAICDICFTQGVLGFWLSLLFIIFSVVMQHLFHANHIIETDEDDEHFEKIQDFNAKIKKMEIGLFFVAIATLGFVLPLGLLNMAYVGLDSSAWFLCGSFSAAIFLIVSYGIYLFKTTKANHSRKLFRDTLKTVSIMAVVSLIGILIVQTCGYDWFAKYEVFEDYASFETFMEDLAIEEHFGDMDRSALTEDDWEYFYEIIYTEEIQDKDGNVLSTYISSNNVSSMSFAFDQSDDGLPIKVLTTQAAYNTYSIQSMISVFLLLLIGAELLCGILYYIYKSRKEH